MKCSVGYIDNNYVIVLYGDMTARLIIVIFLKCIEIKSLLCNRN